MNLKQFVEECKRRKVLSTLSIYALGSWILIQVAATTFPYLGFPKIAVTIVIILALIFFPVVLLFSWFYNVVPDSEELESEEEENHKNQKRLIITITIVIGLIVLFLIFKLLNFRNFSIDKSVLEGDKIAVGEFENFTKNPSLDVIGFMAADWISQGIIQSKIGGVVDAETLREYKSLSRAKNKFSNPKALAELLGSNVKIIKGSYYLQDERLIFKCRILNNKEDSGDHAFENIQVALGQELQAIEELTEKILGYFSILKDRNIYPDGSTPTYEAYQNFYEAKSKWSQDFIHAEQLLRKAISLSPNFTQAKNLLATLLYNTKQYHTLDSLLQNSETEDHFELYMRALLDGKNGLAYELHGKILEDNPLNMILNIEHMLLA